MRFSLVFVAFLTASISQVLSFEAFDDLVLEGSKKTDTIDKKHIITIEYCTSCPSYKRKAERIYNELNQLLSEKRFKYELTPKFGNW